MADHAPEDRTPTKQQAERALAVVVAYLQYQNDHDEKGRDRDCYPGDPPHWDDAKDWAHQILDASGRDDWSGCPLCRS